MAGIPSIDELEAKPAGGIPSLDELEAKPAGGIPSLDELEAKPAGGIPSLDELEAKTSFSPDELDKMRRTEQVKTETIDANMAKTLQDYKETLGAEQEGSLWDKWRQIQKTAIGSWENEGITDAGKKNIGEALKGMRDPIYSDGKPGEDMTMDTLWEQMLGDRVPKPEEAERMSKELQVESANEPRTPEELAARRQIEEDRNPAADTLDMLIKGTAPVATVPAEAIDLIRREIGYLKGGSQGPAPEGRWLDALKGGNREKGVPTGIGDSFENIWRDVAGRDPSEGEHYVLQGLGMAAEMYGPFPVLKILRMTREIPGAKIVADRMAKALGKGGMTEFAWQSFPERKIAQGLRDAEELRKTTTYMGGNLPGRITGPMEQELAQKIALTIPKETPPQAVARAAQETPGIAAFPDRVAHARGELKKTVDAWGGNSQAVDEAFLRDIGPEGINFETAWARWMPELKTKPSEVARIQDGKKILPVGAGTPPGLGKLLAPFSRRMTYEGGVPKGIGSITRQVQGKAAAAQAEAEKAAREIEGSLGEQRSMDLAHWQDARQRRAQLSHWVSETDNDLAQFSRRYAIHSSRLDEAGASQNYRAATDAWDDLRIDFEAYNKAWDDGGDFAGELTKNLKGDIKSLHSLRNEIETAASKGVDFTPLSARFEVLSSRIRTQFDELVKSEEQYLLNTKNKYDALSKELDDAIEGTLKPQNAEEQKAIQFVRENMDEMHERENQILGHTGYAEEYLTRAEKAESKKKHIEIFGAKPAGGGRLFFQRKRLPSTAEISLKGTSLRDFHQQLGEIYQVRAKAHNVAIANALAEDAILKSYSASPMKILDKATEAEVKGQGLVRYVRRYGPERGREYLVDKGTAMFMDRALRSHQNPEGMVGGFLDTWDKTMSWMKGRMTIIRPGFWMRNLFGGNLYNMWLADMDLLPNLRDSAALLAYRQQKHGLRLQPQGMLAQKGRDLATVAERRIYRTFARQIAGKEGTARIAGKSVDELLALAEEAKVFGSGVVGGEVASGIQQKARMGLEAVNVFGNRNLLSRFNSGANKFIEEWCKLALYLDRVKKGFSHQEAAADVAKYLFNTDELSSFTRTAGKAIPFFGWTTKNFGLQLSSLLNRPDKVAKYLRMETLIQDLDPLDPEDMKIADLMPEKLKAQHPVMLPGKRSSKGDRQYFLMGGFHPLASLNLLSLEKLANGKAKDLPGASAQTAIGMLAPPIKAAIIAAGGKAEESNAGFWLGKADYSSDPYVWAPEPVAAMFDFVREKFPKKFEKLIQDRTIVPVFDGEDRFVGYKWQKSNGEIFEIADPAMSWIRRLFPQFKEEQVYSGRDSFFSGFKASDLKKETGAMWQMNDYDQRLKKLQAEERTQQQTGESNKSRDYRRVRGAK